MVFAYYFLKVHLHHFSKISQKEVTKQLESRFILIFLIGDRRIQIRIRIQEAQKHTDPDSGPDPQHWFLAYAPLNGAKRRNDNTKRHLL